MLWVREKIENWLFLGDAQRMADEFQERRERRKERYAETQRRLADQVYLVLPVFLSMVAIISDCPPSSGYGGGRRF